MLAGTPKKSVWRRVTKEGAQNKLGRSGRGRGWRS